MDMAVASLFLLIISFSVVTLSLAISGVNIDCGTSSGSGLDKNNINWVGDKDFITAGELATVSSTTVETSLTTLRYFPTGDSNCYSKIPVKKGGKVLVRTMFYYGNYNGKSSYPNFEVLYDGKHREAVTVSQAVDPFMSELIYIPVNGDINVCFVRTSSGSNPFVSSIEVVELDSGLYEELGPGEGFFYRARVAYGTTGLPRSDHHGRMWFSSGPTALYTVLESTATLIDTSGAANKPPEDVLRNSWSGDIMEITFPILPSQGVPVYLSMYFSEPSELKSFRSFGILFGGKLVNKGPVVPEFGKTTQVVVKDLVVNSSSKLEFRPTPNNSVPPLINALELYVISKDTNGGGSGGGSKSNKEEKKIKLPLIIGLVFFVIACMCVTFFFQRRRRARMRAWGFPA